MRTLAFDGRMGASGDMLLGALLAAGADPGALDPVEETLDVEYRIDRIVRNGIEGTAVDVVLTDADGLATGTHDHSGADQDEHEHSHDDGHSHDAHDHGETHGHDDHSHEHTHDQDHDGDDGHSHDAHDGDDDHDHAVHAEGHGPHRSYTEVVEIVESMDLDSGVESDALAVFRLLGEAEASVHGTTLEEIHFHEVGADDAIADIVGVALLIDELGVERIVTPSVASGGGETSMSHGTYPVPGPATVEIAERADWSLHGGPIEAELLTPTGAAVLAHYADGVDRLPPITVESSGYGAGDWEFPDRPNVLRAIVGTEQGGLEREGISILETNLDDATPETLGSLQETLTDAGARDVTILPTTMKKSRPGHLVKVIVRPEDATRVARRLAAETGTLGVREASAGHRWVADRRIETVEFDLGGEPRAIDVKIATDDTGELIDVSAEHDDALAVAQAAELPVREVRRRAEAAWRSAAE